MALNQMLTIEGNIVNIDGIKRGRIEIGDDGLISAVKEETGGANLELSEDELIFPGFIDLHVHARECADHSQDYKEDFTSAGQAAINGGVVAFADMPNNPLPPVDDPSYSDKYKLAKKSAVDVLLYAGIGPYTLPLSQKVPYKVYMGKSVGDLFFESFGQLENVLEQYRGQSVSFHCEDPKILAAELNRPTHLGRRPVEAEVSAIEFALQAIKKYNLAGKICHVSTQEGLSLIIAAKKAGIDVSCEVTPHHLYFDESMIANKKQFQVNPPIRQTKENRLALVAALKNGDIDYLATDHAPHTAQEKEKGMSGLAHLDTYGCFVTWLMAEHNFSAQDIARVCSYNPAQFFNQFSSVKYGQIAKGFVGSLSIIDTQRPETVVKSLLKTKAASSPFEGVMFPGQVTHTVIKGKIHKSHHTL